MNTERNPVPEDRRVAVDAKHFRAAQVTTVSEINAATVDVLRYYYNHVLAEVRSHLEASGAHYRTDEDGKLVARVRIEVEVLAYPKPEGVETKWFRDQVDGVTSTHYGEPIVFDLPPIDEETYRE